ncbi:MAG: DEAD/DEAH box helicase family protein [Candidatus Moraniibacteriota bacterium]
MSVLTRQQRVDLFQSFFRGREDVFAIRFQKVGTDISGYTPVFTDRGKTEYKTITQSDIENHLLGNVTLGIYPLLKANTSYFIAADFDEKEWKRDAKAFYDTCRKHGIDVALEVSRSGNGAHIWCFFDRPYPASRSRRIFLTLLRQAKCIDDYFHDESFDRLFPNQDMHSGKGLGNLIALPLQGKSRKENKTEFIDPKTFLPFPDQWDFLSGLKKISVEKLDELYENLCQKGNTLKEQATFSQNTPMCIELSALLKIPKQQVTPVLMTYLREKLNFFNSEYIAKSKIGFSTHGVEKFFKTVCSDDDFVYIPRGYLEMVTVFLREQGIDFEVVDKYLVLEDVELDISLPLYRYQQEAVESFVGKNQGMLIAPPGSGKTLMGLAIALSKKQPTLIIVHRKNILEQWVESIHNFLGIQKKEIGKYGGTTKKIKQPFTVAMMQTLARAKEKDEILKHFGCVIVDECHHVPAKMFRKVISCVSSKYLFGLTATPKRKYNDQKLISAYLGETIYEVSGAYREESSALVNPGSANISVVVLKSDFLIPYEFGARDFAHILKLTSFDTRRNKMIADVIQSEVSQKRKVLVIAERK